MSMNTSGAGWPDGWPDRDLDDDSSEDEDSAIPSPRPSPRTLTFAEAALPVSNSLYVGDLHPCITEAEFVNLFAPIGPILSHRFCKDRVTGASRGFGYINYMNASDAVRAMDLLNFEVIYGRSIRVMWSNPDPTFRKSGIGNIIIKNLLKSCDNKWLYSLCYKFGPIRSSKVATDDNEVSKGYGFVHFEREEDSISAIQTLNGLVLLQGSAPLLVEMAWKLENCAYIKNIPIAMAKEWIQQLFSPFGKIISVTFKEFQKVKGSMIEKVLHAIVHYDSPDAVARAVVGIKRTEFDGHTMKVCPAKPRRVRQQEAAEAASAAVAVLAAAAPPTTSAQQPTSALLRQPLIMPVQQSRPAVEAKTNLYVKNIDINLTEREFRAEFEPYGTIKSLKLEIHANGTSKGFGFVCYTLPEEAVNAIKGLNGKLVRGQCLFVVYHMKRGERAVHLSNNLNHLRNIRKPEGSGDGPALGLRQIPAMAPISSAASSLGNSSSAKPIGSSYGISYGGGGDGMPRGQAAGPGQHGAVANTEMVREVGRQLQASGIGPMNGMHSGLNQRNSSLYNYFGQRANEPPGFPPEHTAPLTRFRHTPIQNTTEGGFHERNTIPMGPGFIQALASASDYQRKVMLYERLFPLVMIYQPTVAEKVSSMLVDEVEPSDLIRMLEDESTFGDRLSELVKAMGRTQSQESRLFWASNLLL